MRAGLGSNNCTICMDGPTVAGSTGEAMLPSQQASVPQVQALSMGQNWPALLFGHLMLVAMDMDPP